VSDNFQIYSCTAETAEKQSCKGSAFFYPGPLKKYLTQAISHQKKKYAQPDVEKQFHVKKIMIRL